MTLLRSSRYLLVLALLALAVRPALADGLIRDGLGAIPVGRGGTNLGFYDNAIIINDNPAAMVNVAGNGLLDLNVDTVICGTHYTDADPNNVSSKTRPVPVPELGFIKKSCDGRWAWGIGAFAPAGFGASYQMNQPLLGNPNQLYRSIGGMGKILPALSYKINDRWSIGATFGIAMSQVQLKGPFFLETGLGTIPAVVSLQGFGVAPTGSVGLQYKYSPDTVFGFCYTTQTAFDLRGNTAADVFLGGPPVHGNFQTKTHMVWPSNVAFGVRHNLCPHRIVSAEVVWYGWQNAFDNIGIEMLNPAFAPITPLDTQVPLNWLDSVSMRLGYQWQPTMKNIYRCGYVYHSSPSPDNTLSPLIDGILVHAFSLGYSRYLNHGYLNLGYQYSFGPTRHVGQSIIPGGDFANSTLRADLHVASVGFTVPF